MVLIFDFEDTLYDPIKKELFTEAELVLGELKDQGHNLFLVTVGDSEKETLLSELGVMNFFDKVYVVEKLNEEPYDDIMSTYSHEKIFYVIGDSLDDEIQIGNTVGLTTCWLNKTKKPMPADTPIMLQPNFEMTDLYEIMNYLP